MSNLDGGAGGNRRDRDDTPSVIRYVEPVAGMSGRPTAETMPLLEMPKSQRIWRKVRWPVFGGVVFILLLTIGLITRSIMVAGTIEKNIRDAEALESEGTLDQTEAAEKTLFALYESYSSEDDARSAWAWQTVLRALLWGAPLSEEAAELLEDLDDGDGKYGATAHTGYLLLRNRVAEVPEALSEVPAGPRAAFLEAFRLVAAGERPAARKWLRDKIAEYPGYIPLVTAALQQATADSDKSEMLHFAGILLEKSPANLSAEAAVLRAALPSWGEPSPDAKAVAGLTSRLEALLPRIQNAPPKLAEMGDYLVGRIALAAGRADDAVSALTRVLAKKKDAETVAFAAEAVRAQGNDASALAFLDKHADVKGPETLDVRAQCLLRYHRVDQAEVVVEALKKSGALPARADALSWMLAVRKGDAKTALAAMPRPVGIEDKWLALELYFLLAAAGDKEGTSAVAEALEENWSTCARVIRSWHSKALGRAVRQFDNERLDCAQGLIPRLMRKHMKVADVLAAAEATAAESGKSLLFEVDRAWAVWAASGYEPAVALLDSIAALKPEGAPILEQMGRLYLDMNLPEKVFSLLKGREEPELLALRIFAAEASKKKGKSEKLVERAVQAAKSSAHPALQYFVLRQKLQGGDAEAVQRWMSENSLGAMGQWTSEIATVCARALWALDEKNESEKFLQRTARHTLVPGGAGESLDTFMVQVEQNINRVGKYRNRALVVIRTLKEESVRDPRMSYWLAMENIDNGSERLGLRLLADIPLIDPTYSRYYTRRHAMDRLSDADTALMKKTLPFLKL